MRKVIKESSENSEILIPNSKIMNEIIVKPLNLLK